MSKGIPTTSLAKTKEERKNLRRAVLEHGSTDADAIEDKRQHSARQLIKLGEVVNKLNRQRILMEQQGEKKIATMRENIAIKRAEHAANEKCTKEWLSLWDQKMEAELEMESFQLAALIADSELRTAGLSAQIMAIDTLNLIVDCLSLRERVDTEDGKKVLERITVAAVMSDVLYGVDIMNDKVNEMAEGIGRVVDSMDKDKELDSNDPLLMRNKPIPQPPVGVKA